MNPTTDLDNHLSLQFRDDAGEWHDVATSDSPTPEAAGDSSPAFDTSGFTITFSEEIYKPPRRARRPGSRVSDQLGDGDDPRAMHRRNKQRIHWRTR